MWRIFHGSDEIVDVLIHYNVVHEQGSSHWVYLNGKRTEIVPEVHTYGRGETCEKIRYQHTCTLVTDTGRRLFLYPREFYAEPDGANLEERESPSRINCPTGESNPVTVERYRRTVGLGKGDRGGALLRDFEGFHRDVMEKIKFEGEHDLRFVD